MKQTDTSLHFYIERTIYRNEINVPSFRDHDRYGLYYVLNGEFRCFIHDQVYEAHPYDLILLPSGALHKITEMEGFCEHYLVLFDDTVPAEQSFALLHQLYQTVRWEIPEELRGTVRHMLEQMEEEANNPSRYAASLLRARIEELLALLSQITPPPALQENPFLKTIVSHLAANPDRVVGVAELAALFDETIPMFTRDFRRLTGFGCKDFLKKERLIRAKRQLAHTDLSIAEVAHACGFCDGNYFNTVFTREAGCSPQQFRKNCREEAKIPF